MSTTGEIDAAALSTLGDHLAGPELIIAMVKPVGTPDGDTIGRLEAELSRYGYTLELIKMSRLLSDVASDAGRPIDDSFEIERITALINEGDRLCEEVDDAAALALLAVSEIRRLRIEHNLARKLPAHASSAEFPIARRAYLVDSIKRPAEIVQLRQIYGDHLLIIGLLSSEETRIEKLIEVIRPQRTLGDKQRRELAVNLIARDLRESSKYGQNTLKAFPLSDLFVNVDGEPEKDVERFLKLLFGDPDFQVPTDAEYGMKLAQSASTKSPELGLKVGAAILDAGGSVIALGTNVHPASAGSPSYDASALDIRDLVLDTLRRLKVNHLSAAATTALEDNPDEFVSNLLRSDLADGRILSLTEFQPTVHAEMSALLDALSKGARLEDSVVYVTAFPCHGCAKHLIAMRRSVCYLEPYPKSRAVDMYPADVRARFSAFEGIAPRSYDRLVSVEGDRKMADGSRKKWGPDDRRKARPKVDGLIDWVGIADREAVAMDMVAIFQ